MEVVRTIDRLRQVQTAAREKGQSVGLVPTMGALHAGHLSLINRARKENDIVVTSVFVNPTQFNNPDDLRTYPRTEEADCKLLEAAGVDYAFIPSVQEVYPEPDNRVFDLGNVATVMEGAMRPGHFNGVAQIVSKLFDMVRPTRAYFGEKDFQQIAVIRRMLQSLPFADDIEIVACPIVRENDGLAMSSRNVRLKPEERAAAPAIHRVLEESTHWHESVDDTIAKVTALLNATPHLNVEYYSIVDGTSLQPIANWQESAQPVGCIACFCGDVRLIDNIKYDKA